MCEAPPPEEEKIIAMEAKLEKLREYLIKSKKVKVHLKDDNEGPKKKKDKFTQKKSNTRWTTQWN